MLSCCHDHEVGLCACVSSSLKRVPLHPVALNPAQPWCTVLTSGFGWGCADQRKHTARACAFFRVHACSVHLCT
jgi:hypothetical protein